MLRKFSTFLGGDSGARTPLEEFQGHWNSIQRFYEQFNYDMANDQKSQQVRSDIDALVRLLVQEAKEDSTGPCLEFFLEMRILDFICAAGQVDRPAGMMGFVLRILHTLLSNLQRALIPQMSVHQAISQLIRVCTEILHVDETINNGPENQELHGALLDLLQLQSLLLHKDMSLLHVFFREGSTDSDGTYSEAEFLLFTALLPYLRTEYGKQQNVQAAILHCVQLQSVPVATFIAQSKFAPMLIQTVAENFSRLPATTTLGADQVPHSEAFILSLNFLNRVARNAGRGVATRVADEFQTAFLEPALGQALRQEQGGVALTATAYTAMVAREMTAEPLLHCLTKWLLGIEDQPTSQQHTQDGQPAPEIGNPLCTPLCEVLFTRLESGEEGLCVATLQLFECLLSLVNKRVYHSLMLQYLLKGQHTRTSLPGLVSGQGGQGQGEAVDLMTAQPISASQLVKPAEPLFLIMASPLPLPGSSADPAYQAYLMDAQRQAAWTIQACELWEDWGSESSLQQPPPPSSPPPDPDAPDPQSSGSANSSTTFYEGRFLEVLFNRLEKLLDQPLAINLALTGVLARISQCPHVLLQPFMLDATLPLRPGVRSVPQILAALASQAADRAQSMPNLQQRLESTKRTLSVSPSLATTTGQGPAAAGDLGEAGNESQPCFLQAIVVLEQFLQEMCAIIEAQNKFLPLLEEARTPTKPLNAPTS